MDKEKQRTTPQASMKSKSSLRRTQKKANTCRLTITNIETYCLTRVTWEEVKPILNMVEHIYGFNAPLNHHSKNEKNITGIMGGATLTRYHLANKYKKVRR